VKAAVVLAALCLFGAQLGCRSEEAERSASAQSPVAETGTEAAPARVPGDTVRGPEPERASRIARIRELAAEEARRRGLDGAPEVQAALARLHDETRQREEELLRDALFAAIRDGLVLEEDELRAHYEQTRVRYTERRVRLRRQRFASQAEARAADEALGTAGRLDPALAEELDPMPSAAAAAAVGPETLALTMPGERVLVAEGNGSALVELVDVQPAVQRPFEDVRVQVEKSLRILRAQVAFREEMERLAGMGERMGERPEPDR